MSRNLADDGEEWLVLPVLLSEVAQVPHWIERLASRYAIPEKVQFAINLCLEEVLSNIILHGYSGQRDDTIAVNFSVIGDGKFLVVVDDEAPHFNPLEQEELPALNPNEEMRVGGQGLRLLREFADTIEYEPIPSGNRLKMSFSAFGDTSGTGGS